MTEVMEQVATIIRTETRVHHRVDGSAIAEDDVAHQILSIPEILIKDPDQSLPEIPEVPIYSDKPYTDAEKGAWRMGALTYKHKLLKEHWSKVLPKEEKQDESDAF